MDDSYLYPRLNLSGSGFNEEDYKLFANIRTIFAMEWRPENETEHTLIQMMAIAYLRFGRSLRLEERAIDRADTKLLSLAIRYVANAERSYYKALRELQRLRKPSPEKVAAKVETAKQETATPETANAETDSPAPVASSPMPKLSRKEARRLRRINRRQPEAA